MGRSLLTAVGCVLFAAYGIAQIVAAYQGIEFHWGPWWAAGIMGLCFALRFTLPGTIAAFFGAKDVWEWHWAAALLFAVPGLAVAIPSMLATLVDLGRQRLQGSPDLQHVPAKNVDRALSKSGVGGWLLFLVVVLMILTPVLGYGRLVVAISSAEDARPAIAYLPSWQAYKSLAGWIYAMTAAASVIAGFCLWRVHSPGSVRLAMITLWLIGPVAAIVDAAGAMRIFNASFARAFNPSIIGAVGGTVAVALIWTLYLWRSKRVRNTYGTW
jgi:hypothetical protein